MFKIFDFSLLFLFSVLTVHFLSWVGSVLHSVPESGEQSYAVFTFRTDRNQSMAVNMLMNILIPNVCLVFINLLLYHLGIVYQPAEVIWYIPFYYIYRTILICAILKRRELYSIKYEAVNAVSGIMLSVILTKYFLVHPDKVFIPIEELVNELWLLIFVVVYRFIVLLIDKFFNQQKVVTTEMLEKYIKNRFDIFYKKYADHIHITKKDNKLWILIFAIMIFENYNRGGLIRKFERAKIRSGRTATVGIMQVRSSVVLSDEESIAKAYNILRYDIMNDETEICDEEQVVDLASRYNPDSDYAQSVAFIYSCLETYIVSMPKLSMDFCMNGKTEQNYMTVGEIAKITGLSEDRVMELINEMGVSILLSEEEVKEKLNVYFPEI